MWNKIVCFPLRLFRSFIIYRLVSFDTDKCASFWRKLSVELKHKSFGLSCEASLYADESSSNLIHFHFILTKSLKLDVVNRPPTIAVVFCAMPPHAVAKRVALKQCQRLPCHAKCWESDVGQLRVTNDTCVKWRHSLITPSNRRHSESQLSLPSKSFPRASV